MSSSSESSDINNEDAMEDTRKLLPTKSRDRYEKTYNNFIEWKNSKAVNSFSETVFLDYFRELSKSKQPSTLWSTFSMLKSTVCANNEIKLETYSNLLDYLKKQSIGHKSKKSRVFSRQNVETFLKDAPDKDFLAMKVALIFGVQGACRGKELVQMTVDDVENHSEQLMLVKLKDSKTETDRSFIIRGEYKSIVEKYQVQRPSDLDSNRFFIRYQNGKCFKQVIGKNKISGMPQEIAAYLNLPEPQMYTGHCFRRTSASLLRTSGADLTDLKRKREWKLVSEAVEYMEMLDDNIEAPSENREVPIENEAKTRRIIENIKVELSDDPPVMKLTSQPSASSVQHDPLLSEDNSRRPDSEVISEIFSNKQHLSKTTTISVPNKTVNITFQNCKNVSNININF